MSIVGSHPETGVRIDVVRPRDGRPPWRYEGEAVTPHGRLGLVATVSADGHVAIELPRGAPESIADRVRLIVRAAYKHARDDDQPPPWRISRWRPEVELAPSGRGG